jgi:cysteine-rich repeat protein
MHTAPGADGRFSIEVAAAVYGLRVRLAGYSDAVIENLVVESGAVTEVEVVLAQGTMTHEFPDGGASDSGVPPAGCGDGIVSFNEVCDRGGVNGRIGCAPDCRSLVSQTSGGTSCAAEAELLLVPTNGGAAMAQAGWASSPNGLADPNCATEGGVLYYSFTVERPSRFSANAESGDVLFLRRNCSDATTHIACSGTNIDANLLPGRYSLMRGTKAPGVLKIAVTPLTPPEFCGDGVISGSEECDDGNNLNGDSCLLNCTVPKQSTAADCLAPAQLQLTPTRGMTRTAVVSGNCVSTGNTPPAQDCASGASATAWFVKLSLERAGRLSLVADGCFINLWDISSRSCMNGAPRVACIDDSAAPRETLSATLDAGTYLVGVGSLDAGVCTATLVVEPL